MSRRRMFLLLGVCFVAIAMVALLAGCGDETESTTATSQSSSTSESSTESTTATSESTETSAAGAAETLRIGVLVAMTDWYSPFDMINFEECQVTADMINDEGGVTIDGTQYLIELVPEDIKSTLDGTTAAATKLAYDAKVQFVIGPSAYFGSASAPVLEEAGVMHVATYNVLSPAEMGPDTPLGFLGTNSVAGACSAMAGAFREQFPDAKTAVFMCPDDGAVQNVFPVAKEALERAGFTVLGDAIAYPNETVDFSPFAAKVNAQNADVTFQSNGTPEAFGNIVKALRESGNTKPYGGAIGASAADIARIAGPEATTDILVIDVAPDNPSNTPEIQEIISRLYEARGEQRSIFLLSATTLWSLVDVIREANSLDPQVVAKTWEGMTTIESLYGPANVGGTETYGIANHALGHPQPYDLIENGEVATYGWKADVIIP